MSQQAQNVTASLCTMKGAVRINRGDLVNLATPPRTLSHRPVAHSDFLNLIEMRLNDRKIQVENCDVAIMNDGMRLFGTMVLKREQGDYAFALGFRAANDKSMAMELVAGARVFVCDNMTLSGDDELLWRKHTSGLNPRNVIFAGVDRAIAKFSVLQNRIGELKQIRLSDIEAKAKIYDMVEKNIVNQNALPIIGKNYFEPTHNEQAREFGGTMWMLNNAVTEYCHTLRPNVAMQVSQDVGAFMGL